MIARWHQCGTMTSQMFARASFSVVCLTVFPFEFRPRTFTIGFYGKKLIISEIMILECSFPLRNSHFKDRLLLYRTSPRQLWTTIKYITNKQRLPLQVPVPLIDLSRYFERLLQQPGEYITLPYGPNNINSLQTFVPVTPTEIEGLSQLNPRKSPGPDMISPLELKMVKQQISTQLSIIFNESLATGILPAEFKTGNISPSLKPGKRDNSAKVLEKIVHQQLEAHFHKIGAYHEDQHGFMKGRSCDDLLLATIDDWLIAKDHKMSTSIVFIDLSSCEIYLYQFLLIRVTKMTRQDAVQEVLQGNSTSASRSAEPQSPAATAPCGGFRTPNDQVSSSPSPSNVQSDTVTAV